MTQYSSEKLKPAWSPRTGARLSGITPATIMGARSVAPMVLFLATMTLAIWHDCTCYFQDQLIGLIVAGIGLLTMWAQVIGASAINRGGDSLPYAIRSAHVRRVGGRLIAAIAVAMTANFGELGLAIACARFMMMHSIAWARHSSAPIATAIHAAAIDRGNLAISLRLARTLLGAPSTIIANFQGFHR